MGVFAHQLLLLASVAALAAAGLRVAALVAQPGLERAVAAAPLAAAAAALEALGLGLLGLSDQPLALAGAAGLTAVAAFAFIPRRDADHQRAARRLRRGERAALGAALGLGAAWLAWMLWRPLIGIDGVTYQLPEAVAWVHSGRTGTAVPTFYDVPTASYPLANEVLISWAMGISRTLAAGLVVAPSLAVLLVASAWLGLRRLGAPRGAVALAIAALLTVPFVVQGVTQPGSDIPSAAWLACCAGLVAASRRRPTMVAPALVAAGLAIGTKTTALPLTIVVMAAALAMHRGEVARLRRPLVSAAVVAGLVGVSWYLRNLVEHGSPLWPFAGGDPAPPLFDRLDHSLLERPRATLSAQVGRYWESLGGALLLFAAAVAAPALVRRPAVVWGALATAGSLLLYAAGPVTGRPDVDELAFLPATTVRYLLPAIAAASVTLALAARHRRGRVPAQAALAAAVVLSLVASWPFGYSNGPPLVLAAAGVLGGAGVAAASFPIGLRPAIAGVALIAAAVLTFASGGLVKRHAKLNANRFSGLSFELDRRADFSRSRSPVATNSSPLATLAGDHLDRRVELIPARESCTEVERRSRSSWIVLSTSPPFTYGGRPTGLPTQGPARCLAARRPDARAGDFRVYAPTR